MLVSIETSHIEDYRVNDDIWLQHTQNGFTLFPLGLHTFWPYPVLLDRPGMQEGSYVTSIEDCFHTHHHWPKSHNLGHCLCILFNFQKLQCNALVSIQNTSIHDLQIPKTIYHALLHLTLE